MSNWLQGMMHGRRARARRVYFSGLRSLFWSLVLCSATACAPALLSGTPPHGPDADITGGQERPAATGDWSTGNETRVTDVSCRESPVPVVDPQPAHGIEPVRFPWPSLFVTFDRAPWFVPLSYTGMGGTNSACGIPLTSLRLRTDDLQLRPPLRQLWFHHPRLIPEGGLDELDLPHREILAHSDHFRMGTLRNPYAGFRDQPLLHRDTSRAPETNSRLPEIGPPPPRHTIKTFGTLTSLAIVGVGVYALAPSDFTGVAKGKAKDDAWNNFKDAWTKPPVFDKDGATVNYLGHPYFGALYYLSQRNYGESPLYSFLFSSFTSACYEYFIESWAERPSVQDLFITPIVGSILGELVFQATQKMRKDGFTKAEKVMVTVINPLYVLQNGYR